MGKYTNSGAGLVVYRGLAINPFKWYDIINSKKGGVAMICEKCGCADVRIQAVSVTKRKRKGLIYWLLIGWWLELFMWLFLTLPWLIIKIFKPKKYKDKITSMAVCQGCGYSWKV